MVGNKRGKNQELQDPTIPYDQDLKKVSYESTVSEADDEERHNEIQMGAFSSHALPPPPPIPVEILDAIDWGKSKTDSQYIQGMNCFPCYLLELCTSDSAQSFNWGGVVNDR